MSFGPIFVPCDNLIGAVNEKGALDFRQRSVFDGRVLRFATG